MTQNGLSKLNIHIDGNKIKQLDKQEFLLRIYRRKFIVDITYRLSLCYNIDKIREVEKMNL